MKLLIVLALTLATALALPSKEVKPRNIIVPAGNPEGRITHGSSARPGQFPYQVGLIRTLEDGRNTWCGGSLISNTHVLTAAHCTQGAVKVKVLLGTINRQTAEVLHEVDARDIVIHRGYNDDTVENDISLIKIPYTAYTTTIKPIKLPSKGSVYSSYSGETAVASGWGRISDSSTKPQTLLQYAKLSIIPNNICGKTFAVKPSNICVATFGGVSTCQGDSGGPLVLASSKTLVGLTSYGAKAGCELQFPIVFTRITSYLDWIQQHSY